jgi:outer membrane protein assembly factor BamB
MRAAATLAALMLAAGLSACSSLPSMPSVPTFSSLNPFNWFGGKKLAPLPELRSNEATIAWSASVGKSGGYLFVPAVTDRLVYATGNNGRIHALAEDGGRSVAQIDANTDVSGGVGAADNFVVVASTKGEILAFDAAGRSLWKTNVGGEVIAPPGLALASVIVRTSDGRIFALSRMDGKRQWVFQRAAPALTLRSNAGVLINRGTVYAGFPGGKLIAIELDSGKPVWEASLSLPRGATELERIADVSGWPVLDNSRICAAVFQGRTGCLETLSGNVLWSRDIPSADGVAVDAKNLYVVDTSGNIYALEKSTGSTVWKQEKLASRDPGTPLVMKDRILVGDMTGVVHVLSLDNGDLTGRVNTDGGRVVALLAGGDRAIAQTDRGGVYAIFLK